MIGKHNDVPDSKFNKEQLRMGIEVEKEHTDDPEISKNIAKDHLVELPDYYTRLKKMEEEGMKDKKKTKVEHKTVKEVKKLTPKEKMKRLVEHFVSLKLRSLGLVKEEKEQELEDGKPEGKELPKPSDPKDESKGDTLLKVDVNTKGESLKKVPGQRGAIRAGENGRGGEAEITLDEWKKNVRKTLREFTPKATRQAGHVADFYKENPGELRAGSSPSDVGFATVSKQTGQTRGDAKDPFEDDEELGESGKCGKWWKSKWAKKEG